MCPQRSPWPNTCAIYSWGMLKDKLYSTNPYNEDNIKKRRKEKTKEVKKVLNLTSINSIWNEHVSWVWCLCVSRRKPFPAPVLNMIAKTVMLTAIRKSTRPYCIYFKDLCAGVPRNSDRDSNHSGFFQVVKIWYFCQCVRTFWFPHDGSKRLQ